MDVVDLGYLDGGTETDVIRPCNNTSMRLLNVILQIKAGTKVQLPYWIAAILLIGYVHFFLNDTHVSTTI